MSSIKRFPSSQCQFPSSSGALISALGPPIILQIIHIVTSLIGVVELGNMFHNLFANSFTMCVWSAWQKLYLMDYAATPGDVRTDGCSSVAGRDPLEICVNAKKKKKRSSEGE